MLCNLKQILTISTLLSLFVFSTAAKPCVLKMGYKDGEKKPLIGPIGDNTGTFQDLFTEAAEKIGCKLVIYRIPKKRALQGLQIGLIDFYPGASFSIQRSKYLFYIKNGLITAELGLTPLNVPDIKSYHNVKSLNFIWLMEPGSTKKEIADTFRIQSQQTPNVTIDKVMLYFESRGVNFYVADKELIDQFTFKKPDYFLEYNGLQLHKNCCGGVQPMYLGFSKKSVHIKLVKNLNFDETQAPSPSNQRESLDTNSIAYRYEQALAELASQGVTEQYYLKHLGVDLPL